MHQDPPTDLQMLKVSAAAAAAAAVAFSHRVHIRLDPMDPYHSRQTSSLAAGVDLGAEVAAQSLAELEYMALAARVGSEDIRRIDRLKVVRSIVGAQVGRSGRTCSGCRRREIECDCCLEGRRTSRLLEFGYK